MTKKIEKVMTTGGELTKVSLEEFIALIGVERCTDLVSQYNSTVSYGTFEDSTVPAGDIPQQEDSTYIRTAVLLNENSAHNQLLHILDQVSFLDTQGKDRNDKVEIAAVHSLENFGVPTHIVEITWNCWGVFCIEDFKYKFMDPTKGAIICYAPARNVIFRSDY